MFKEGPAPTTTKDLTLLGRTGHHLDLNELSELFVNGIELSKSVARNILLLNGLELSLLLG